MTRRIPTKIHEDSTDRSQSTENSSIKDKSVFAIPGGHGIAFYAPAGSHVRVTDLHGEQVIDLLAWVSTSPRSYSADVFHDRSDDSPSNDESRLFRLPIEHLSTSQTRYHHRGVMPNIGESIYTNASRPLFKVVKDTVKCHDMTFQCCSPELYKELLGRGEGEKHRSCATNIAAAVTEFLQQEMLAEKVCNSPRAVRCCNDCYSANFARGSSDIVRGYSNEAEALEEKVNVHYLQVHDPFNIFQNTPNYTLKAFGNSKTGDYIEFEVLIDAIVALSCCPFDIGGFNGGKSTDVEVNLEYPSRLGGF